jgi:RNA polymerase sigma factor (sigma-70 family)
MSTLYPDTRWSLVARFQEGTATDDDKLWLYDNYGPCIECCGRRWGLQPTDAADLVHDVIVKLFDNDAMKKFERLENKRFRSWLGTIVNNAILNLIKKSSRFQTIADPDAFLDLADTLTLQTILDFLLEAEELVNNSLPDEKKQVDWRIYWARYHEGKTSKECAADPELASLKLTPDNIQKIGQRIRERVKERAQELFGSSDIFTWLDTN